MENGKKHFYVYGWFNIDWQRWFYVGKGMGNRYREIEHRSNRFKEIVSCFQCKPCILISEISESGAINIENKLKEILIETGEPITDGEHELSSKNQRKGIEIAKAKGKYKGRKPIDVDEKTFAEEYKKLKNGDTVPKLMMKKLGLKPNTFYRRVHEYEVKHGIVKKRLISAT